MGVCVWVCVHAFIRHSFYRFATLRGGRLQAPPCYQLRYATFWIGDFQFHRVLLLAPDKYTPYNSVMDTHLLFSFSSFYRNIKSNNGDSNREQKNGERTILRWNMGAIFINWLIRVHKVRTLLAYTAWACVSSIWVLGWRAFGQVVFVFVIIIVVTSLKLNI